MRAPWTRASAVVLLLLAATAAHGEPELLPAAPPALAPPGACDERIARVRQLVDVFAREERHDRLLRGGIGLTLSSFQIATGAYLLTVRESYERPYVALAGWLNVGPPEYVFLRSIVLLALRGPLEKLRDRLDVARPCNEQQASLDLERLELAWAAAARRARRIRLVSAAVYITVGLGVLGYSAYLLFAPPVDEPPRGGQYIIGSELAVGAIAYVGHGISDAVMVSPVEQALDAYRAGLTPPRPTALRLVPSVQGVPGGALWVLSGRF